MHGGVARQGRHRCRCQAGVRRRTRGRFRGRRPGRSSARIATYVDASTARSGHREQPGATSSRSALGSSGRSPARGAERPPAASLIRPPVRPIPSYDASASVSAVGKRAVSVPRVHRVACRRRRPADAQRYGPTRPKPAAPERFGPAARSRRPPRAPGPGRAATSGARCGSSASVASTAIGSASASSIRRHRATVSGRVRTSSMLVVRLTARRRSAGRRPIRTEAPGGRSSVELLDAGNRCRPQPAEHRRDGVRRPGGQSQRQCAGAGQIADGRRRMSRGAMPKWSRIVSLNCRRLANPAVNATVVIGRSVASSSSRAVCARRVRASASGPAPTSATSTRCRWRSLTCSDRASAGTPPSAIRRAVDRSRRDRPQRPRREVAAQVPLPRPGRGLRPAALAGAEAGRHGRRRTRIEPHVLALRRLRRARRPTVDAGRGHGGDEPAVEPGVTAGNRAIAAVVVFVHVPILLPEPSGSLAGFGHGRLGRMHDDLLARRADYPILDGKAAYLINNSLGAMHRDTPYQPRPLRRPVGHRRRRRVVDVVPGDEPGRRPGRHAIGAPPARRSFGRASPTRSCGRVVPSTSPAPATGS